MGKKLDNLVKKMNYIRMLMPMLALSLGVGLGIGAQSIVLGQHTPQAGQQSSGAKPVAALASPSELSRAFIEVAKQVKPAVVNIDVVEKPKMSAKTNSQRLPQIPGFPPFGQMEPRAQRGTGSGVIISPDGYILTNNHVAGEADEIKIKLADGREFKGRRIGADPETDLALVKIDAQNLPYAQLGDSAKLEQGEWVVALGSPFGLQQTMTAGIVSAIGRDLRAGPYDSYIQTDASINPGNSGGPLVNMQGEVIGINTMIFSRSGGSEGIGFAIPSNMAKKVYAQLAKNGKVSRGYLGVNLQALTPSLARSVSYANTEGALVSDLSADSPAYRAGLRSGDVITEFDSQKVASPKQLTELVADTAVGKTVQVKYVRDGHTQSTSIKLGERPSRDEAENRETLKPSNAKLGISVTTVTPEIASELKLKTASGAVIEQVQPDSPAAEAGLRRGDVIHRLNRTPITNAQELTDAVRSLSGEKEVALQVERNGQLTFISVTLE